MIANCKWSCHRYSSSLEGNREKFGGRIQKGNPILSLISCFCHRFDGFFLTWIALPRIFIRKRESSKGMVQFASLSPSPLSSTDLMWRQTSFCFLYHSSSLEFILMSDSEFQFHFRQKWWSVWESREKENVRGEVNRVRREVHFRKVQYHSLLQTFARKRKKGGLWFTNCECESWNFMEVSVSDPWSWT